MIMRHCIVVMRLVLMISAMVVLSIMIHIGMLHLAATVMFRLVFAVICKRGY
jgi:hypothetical protein